MFNSQNLIKIIKLGVYLALLAPLVYISQTIFGTVFGKIIYFQIVIEAFSPFFIYFIIFYKNYRPKIDFLTKLILGFFGIILLSSLFGVDWNQSFWGEPSRMRGIFTLLHLLTFYFYIITVFRTTNEKKQLIFFILLVGLGMAIFGFFERLYPQINIDKTSIKSSMGHRVMSTTGNSIFFAGFLLFMVFLSVYYFFIEEKRYRWVFLAGAAFFTLILFYTGTRAAFVGFIIGMFFLFIYLFLTAQKKKKIIIFSIFLLFIVFFLGILGLSKLSIKDNKLIDFDRLTELSLSDMDGSIKGRLLLWKISFSPFKERWRLGWGMENFDYVFNKYYDPHFLINGVNETFSDRAHNIYIDIAIMTGIFGLLAFLSVFVYSGLKFFKKEYFKKENAPLLGLLVGFASYMFFSIDSPSVNIMIFFILALFYLIFNKKDNHQFAQSKVSSKKIWLLFFILPVIFFIYFYNIKPLYAGIDSLKFKYSKNFEESKRMAENFLSIPIYNNEFNIIFANNVFFGNGNDDLGLRRWEIDKAIEVLEKNNNLNKNFSSLFLLGNLYLRRGSIFKENDDFIKALDYYDKALQISPRRQSVMFQVGTTYLFLGKTDEAIEILQKAVALDEDIGQSHWRLGITYLAAGKENNAYKEFKDSIDLGFFGTIESELTQAAALCEKIEDNDCMLRLVANIYRIRRSQDPQNIENFKMLANIYIELHDYEQAKECILEAIRLNPSLKTEGEGLLRQIEE